jgi:hypothetical protein
MTKVYFVLVPPPAGQATSVTHSPEFSGACLRGEAIQHNPRKQQLVSEVGYLIYY